MNLRILAFSSTLRTDSLNRKLVHEAAEAARQLGSEVTVLDLRDLHLPIYDGDDEAARGLPEGAKHLKQLMKDNDAFLISTGEYNGSVTGALKNAIDWASRPAPDEEPLEPFRGKIAALLSASPGGYGGINGLFAVRSILERLLVIAIPNMFVLPHAEQAFGPDGKLLNTVQQKSVEAVVRELIRVTASLHAPDTALV
jgi:NAD(P)H-dependent FMN reductase